MFWVLGVGFRVSSLGLRNEKGVFLKFGFFLIEGVESNDSVTDWPFVHEGPLCYVLRLPDGASSKSWIPGCPQGCQDLVPGLSGLGVSSFCLFPRIHGFEGFWGDVV